MFSINFSKPKPFLTRGAEKRIKGTERPKKGTGRGAAKRGKGTHPEVRQGQKGERERLWWKGREAERAAMQQQEHCAA